MSDTPLSDLMADHADNPTPEKFERIVALFRASVVGIVGIGPVRQDAQGRHHTGSDFGAGRTSYSDGQPRILAFADPEAFIRNFGQQFNAGISGEVLLQMAATDPECHGILVNSATREISVIIGKEATQS